MKTAERHPASLAVGPSSAEEKHCVFQCGQLWFSVPALTVRELASTDELVQLPVAPPTLAGICHLRSEFVPVISLEALLQVDSSPHHKSGPSNLLVLDGPGVWAIAISETASLESLETLVSPEQRGEAVVAADRLPTSMVIGTAMLREKIVRVLDCNAIYRTVQQTLDDAWSGVSGGGQQMTGSWQ